MERLVDLHVALDMHLWCALVFALPLLGLRCPSGRNPAFSVKCRIGASMIWEAEKSGALRPGMTVVEPTSGVPLGRVQRARGCLAHRLHYTHPTTRRSTAPESVTGWQVSNKSARVVNSVVLCVCFPGVGSLQGGHGKADLLLGTVPALCPRCVETPPKYPCLPQAGP